MPHELIMSDLPPEGIARLCLVPLSAEVIGHDECIKQSSTCETAARRLVRILIERPVQRFQWVMGSSTKPIVRNVL